MVHNTFTKSRKPLYLFYCRGTIIKRKGRTNLAHYLNKTHSKTKTATNPLTNANQVNACHSWWNHLPEGVIKSIGTAGRPSSSEPGQRTTFTTLALKKRVRPWNASATFGHLRQSIPVAMTCIYSTHTCEHIHCCFHLGTHSTEAMCQVMHPFLFIVVFQSEDIHCPERAARLLVLRRDFAQCTPGLTTASAGECLFVNILSTAQEGLWSLRFNYAIKMI